MQVEASLDANGVVGGVSIGVSLATKISNALKTSNVNYSINAHIDGISTLQTPEYNQNPDVYTLALINFALSFSTQTPDDPKTISFELEPYEETVLPAEVDFSKIRQNRIQFLGNPANPGWGELYSQILMVYNTCKEFRDTHQFYGNYNDPSLDSKFIQIKSDIDAIFNFIQKISEKPNEIYKFQNPESYSYGIPILNYTTLVPVGTDFLNGGGGATYQDVTIKDIPGRIKLASIQVSQGDIVDMLIAKYSKVPPANNTVVQHGTPGGKQMNEWILGQNEYITSISGYMEGHHTHTVVAGLNFKSNLGNTYNSRELPDSTQVQKWDAETGDVLIGFSGSSGDNLDCLQPLVLRFSPITWIEYSLKK